ncbi:TonB-dependent receptor plug domain-containing protein [Sphingomonas sp. 22R3R2A-7]|uniref:TonB-dependent receptor plug domain-containing protein n=1 Tax=Sphingomonas sp. 22R3R2A-7 TaxID=3050230 RepID=UPI003FA6BFC0
MRLQDTPIAISAYTTEQLARSGVRDLRDIVTFTPGLTIGTGEGRARCRYRSVGSGRTTSASAPTPRSGFTSTGSILRART